MNKLRIAQIAHLWESVPPSKYGAVEYLISLLCDHLVQKGHSVTLFASGDSKTKAFLEPICDESLNKSQRIIEPEIYRMIQFQKIRQCAENFDIIHSHIHSNSGCLVYQYYLIVTQKCYILYIFIAMKIIANCLRCLQKKILLL